MKQIAVNAIIMVLLLSTLVGGLVVFAPGGKVEAFQCGSGTNAVTTSINFGCRGSSCHPNCNAVLDMIFAIIRDLSDGAGLVIVLGLIIAGIQYTTSGGDPQARAKALGRVQHVVIALFVFIFAYAILNYLIPAGVFQ